MMSVRQLKFIRMLPRSRPSEPYSRSLSPFYHPERFILICRASGRCLKALVKLVIEWKLRKLAAFWFRSDYQGMDGSVA